MTTDFSLKDACLKLREITCERGLGNVCSHNALPNSIRSFLKDLGLEVTG